MNSEILSERNSEDESAELDPDEDSEVTSDEGSEVGSKVNSEILSERNSDDESAELGTEVGEKLFCSRNVVGLDLGRCACRVFGEAFMFAAAGSPNTQKPFIFGPSPFSLPTSTIPVWMLNL